ncbi:alpha/beta fold hydrolase [Massilia cavernae]|uniref:Alpha/beta hydrolase n=1 Tax=Massilia cavernae TaxID=2320864 RepID=A0A418XEK9_9BURK|nr:alpha/beta hydrolase [Massilia cavernae]RJG10820.1 alpha/beta hydrolase [Massilia cavernae]
MSVQSRNKVQCYGSGPVSLLFAHGFGCDQSMWRLPRVTFLADHRSDLARPPVPALILQCSDDPIAPRTVGGYLHQHLPGSTLEIIDNVGHCPHLSAPDATATAIDAFLALVLERQ